ncbi:Arm DNA-binding domain-containing protein [Allofustis seminis]|uniref:Arm DNA-binding domain-containing protein n=1 Tax=Allofustis seminis TaxID=166939 RepID=UPI00039EC3CC|nr:Arm DNA-binding domain-containing protein [Allofustis seminis]
MGFLQKIKEWQYQISYKDVDGKYRELSCSGFRTKTEAIIEAEERKRRLNLGYSDASLNGELTFIEYLRNWYDIFKRPNLSPVTNDRNKFFMKTIEKYFNNIRLDELNKSAYQQKINAMEAKYAKTSVNKMNILCAECLSHATYEGHIKRNLSYNIKISGKLSAPASSKYLEIEEAEKLLKVLEDEYQPSYTARGMCIVSLKTGMRLGEIMALTHDTIDFEKNTIHITKSWDYKVTKDFFRQRLKIQCAMYLSTRKQKDC